MELTTPDHDATSMIIEFSNHHGNLFRKFSTSFFVNVIDVHKLSGFSQFLQNSNNEISIELFVAYFGSNIEHLEHESLFLMIGLYDFYE